MALLIGADGAQLLGVDGVPLNDGLPTSEFNYTNTIISQYGNSPVILAMIASMDTALDPCANITAFFNAIWNIATASGYGLDVWGRIVGVGRVLNVAAGSFLGFAEPADGSEAPFNQAPFWSGNIATTSNYALPDALFRTVILAKAMSNICNGSIPAINAILQALFPSSGTAYCTDGQNMTMTYTFSWLLSPVQYAIVTQSGVLPKPCGVTLSIVQL